jgi:Rrf2 family protein
MNAFAYGKMSQTAVAALSFLSEHYDGGVTRFNSAQVAAARNLPQPVAAKVLTQLSQAGIVTGAPGPGGGYALARDPADVTLYDVVLLFERFDQKDLCPFGPGWCGVGNRCPLHDELARVQEQFETFLRGTRFSVFRTGEGSGSLGAMFAERGRNV